MRGVSSRLTHYTDQAATDIDENEAHEAFVAAVISGEYMSKEDELHPAREDNKEETIHFRAMSTEYMQVHCVNDPYEDEEEIFLVEEEVPRCGDHEDSITKTSALLAGAQTHPRLRFPFKH